MKDVVARLEACVSVGDVAINDPEEGSALSPDLAEDNDENTDQTKDALRAEIEALRAENKVIKVENKILWARQKNACND